MPRTRRRTSGSPVPPLHVVMIASATLLIIVFATAYAFVPPAKEALFASGVTLMIGFLTGKLSNSFGKPIIPPSIEEAPTDGDPSAEESA